VTEERSCFTRRLKQARYLQRRHPEIVPTPEPSEGFETVLEGSDPSLRFALRDALDASQAAAPDARASRARFAGALHLVRPTISGPKAGPTAVPAEAVTVVQRYLDAAHPLIARYAAQYGTVALRTGPAVLEAPAIAPHGRYNDSTLRGWVDEWVRRGGLPATGAAAVVLNPPGAVNTDADPSRGILGYHSAASIPYAFVNLFETPISVADAEDRFALGVSHVVAELAVDPAAELSNPEVCDPCGQSGAGPIRTYFDESGAYLGSTAEFPPPFPYGFYLSAVARPTSATATAASPEACGYGPP
jgi:hypothetical protein